jgi:hypothetical protein
MARTDTFFKPVVWTPSASRSGDCGTGRGLRPGYGLCGTTPTPTLPARGRGPGQFRHHP